MIRPTAERTALVAHGNPSVDRRFGLPGVCSLGRARSAGWRAPIIAEPEAMGQSMITLFCEYYQYSEVRRSGRLKL